MIDTKRCDFVLEPGPAPTCCGKEAKWRTWDRKALCDDHKISIEDQLADRRAEAHWIIPIDEIRLIVLDPGCYDSTKGHLRGPVVEAEDAQGKKTAEAMSAVELSSLLEMFELEPKAERLRVVDEAKAVFDEYSENMSAQRR